MEILSSNWDKRYNGPEVADDALDPSQVHDDPNELWAREPQLSTLQSTLCCQLV
jgi:hypothetical protein